MLSVSVLVLDVELGLNVTDIPLGIPAVTAKFTLPLHPFRSFTEMLIDAGEPTPMVTTSGSATVSVNLGTTIIRAKVVVAVTSPDVPVTVT